MPRLNWANRQGPGEFDNTAPPAPTLEFDHTRSNVPQTDSWPKGFGPATIQKAWKAGLVVVAELEGRRVAAIEARWSKGKGTKVLEVKDQGCWWVPDRLYTQASVRGLVATGEIRETGNEG